MAEHESQVSRFVSRYQELLKDFEAYWQDKQKSNTAAWPDELTDSQWLEQFEFFINWRKKQ